MKNLFSLDGKVIVVTGGAGYLGSAVVKGLLEFGAYVMVADMNIKSFEEIVGSDKSYDKLCSMPCDVSSTSSIREMFKETYEKWGRIDVLINCATYGAGYGAASGLEDMSDADWQKGLDGAVGTAFRCTREVMKYFDKNPGGNIINFGSMYGMVSPDPGIYGLSGQNNPVNYGAGKAAVLQMTRYCAAHMANKNIRVNSVTPGPFPNVNGSVPGEFLDNLSSKTILGRVGRPEEIVGAVVFLASDASSFMTGSNIVVDGGWTAW